MFIYLRKAIFPFIFIGSLFFTSLQADEDHNLTDAQLHAFLTIITNFILEDSPIKLDAPTLLGVIPSSTVESNVSVSIQAEVNASIFLNGNAIGTTDENGTATFTVPLIHGTNTIEITVKDTLGNQSYPLVLNIVSNIPPIVYDVNITVDENSNANSITLNATDSDGDALTYSIVTQAIHGSINISGSVVTYTPSAGYNGSDSFTYKANDGMSDSSPAIVNITVAPALKIFINEISSAYYLNDDRWFEIYNPNNVDVDISAYTLKSRAYSGTGTVIDSFEFTFASKIIPSGSYLIIRPDYGPAYNTTLADIENEQVMYLKDSSSTKYPLWFSDTSGYLEILKNGNTIDFVSIGAEYTPTTASEWTGSFVPSFTSSSSEFWKSIARDSNSSDTNTLSDWTVREFPTYAAVNDVTCNDDVDEDGIPDCSEINGSTYAGIDLYAFGARTNQKDIFIEVDYIDSTKGGSLPVDEGVIPQQQALSKVKDSFFANGYVVHFDVGDLYAQDGDVINPLQMDLGGGNEVAYAKSVSLDSSSTENTVRAYKVNNMQVQRYPIFYYMLFGTSQNLDGSNGSSGLAELPGNDSLITLGGWGLNSNTVSETNTLINFQAGTVMHEFGHNLNLRHGGNEEKNYKPNYMSVMNYLYQLNGLATIGDNEGDRYYNNKGAGCPNDALTNPYNGDPTDFIVDYSHGLANTLEEATGIDEANGLGHLASVPVDFNCNGNASDVIANFNVNPDFDTTIDTLTDHNDWNAINLIFARTYSGSSGISRTSSQSTKVSINPLVNDKQPIAVELPIKIPMHILKK